MSSLLGVFLANAVAAGLLAAVAWVLSQRLRRQALLHGLWVVALVKLVTPPIVPLPLLPDWQVPDLTLPRGPATVILEEGTVTGPLWSPSGESDAPVAAAAPDDGRAPRQGSLPSSPAELNAPLAPSRTASVEASGPSLAKRIAAAAPLDPAAIAWTTLLVGALVVSLLASHRVRRFRRLLRLGAPAPLELRERTAELAKRIGLRRAPRVLLLPARVPPMLWPAAGGPLLLLPRTLLPELTEEERDTLLVHELAHVRRRDHWVRLLELAVTVLFWWYPVTWWVRRALRRAEERCCDEWVLRVMPDSGPAYAQGLLKSLDLLAGEPAPLPVGASGAVPVRDLETRLKEIVMTTRPAPRLAAPVRLAVAVGALLGLAVFPTRAEPPGAEDEPALASPVVPETPPEPPAPDVAPVLPAPPAAVPEGELPAPPAAGAEGELPAPPPAVEERALPALPAPPAPVVTPPDVPGPPAPAVAAPAAPTPVEPVLSAPGPSPSPRAAVAPVPSPRPLAVPAPAVAPRPAPVVNPARRQLTPVDEAALREIEEKHRQMEAERDELHQRELTLAQERMAREAAAQGQKLEAQAERLRAAGEEERAERVELRARATAERMELQQKQVALELTRLEEQRQLEGALRSKADDLRAMEREGREEEAQAARLELARLEQEQMRRQLAHEERQAALQREVMEAEHRAQAAEMQMEHEMSAEMQAEMQSQFERQRERMELEQALHEQELKIHEAEQAIHQKELEAMELDTAGERKAAEAARVEVEAMRADVEARRQHLHQERLTGATSDIERQMESQLEALRHVRTEGLEDTGELDNEIARLEAALAALRR